MRTFAISLLLFALITGCTKRSPLARLPNNTENTWTWDALKRGDIIAVKNRVLGDPSYILERDDDGNTPLMYAIAFGNLELVRFLLEHGADPNVEVDDGYTCLLTAIESDSDASTLIVTELIRASADIHTMGTNGWTPLHMAAAYGHVDKARLLIDAGADINSRRKIDASETPLMEAALMGQPSTVRLLLANGADPTMRDTINNRTPLEIAHHAARGPDPYVVDYLDKENFQIDADQIFDGMDLSSDDLEMVKETIKDIDMKQDYIGASNQLIETGNHAEVIRILTEHSQ